MKPALMILILLFICSCKPNIEQKIDLSGEWQFRIDSLDRGVAEKWYAQNFQEFVKLPGSLAENGKGSDIASDTKWTGGVQNPEWYNDPNFAPYHDPENIRFPFWLQPVKKYTGAAWYQKTVDIPKSWSGKNVFLNLERPHWESTVWINGENAGMQNSLASPHEYDVTSYLKTGTNLISICIDNRTKDIDVGENSHSISDHTQSNWNGIVGEIALQCSHKIYFKNVQVFPNAQSNSVAIKAEVRNSDAESKKVVIRVSAKPKQQESKSKTRQFEFVVPAGESTVSMEYRLEYHVLTWDEFNPNLYTLSLEMNDAKGRDEKQIDFGFRDFTADSAGLKINGRPVFLRGALECAIFPITGYPPTDVDSWKKVYSAVKAHGLNHVRFHSWCPPEAAFLAANEMGVYLMVECSSWANQSTRLGSGLPIDQYIYEEGDRILKTYGNNPSFVMMAYGNEPGGPGHVQYLKKLVHHWKEKDNRRLYTGGAGWPVIDENDFHVTHRRVRIQGWGEELNSIINGQAPRSDYDWRGGISGLKSPMVSHEIGQWCAYPNFKEIEKYTGVLKAKNFELFRESLHANHMGHLADSFLLASGKLQVLCYKADIEAALRTPKFGGFQLLDLHDFPGQGTALVGVLDAFWEEKGYVSPEEYRQFCNTTVPLARFSKHIFNEGDTLSVDIEVAHFGNSVLLNSQPHWKISQGESIIAEGKFSRQDIPLGNCIKLGTVHYTFPTENKPRKLSLEVSVDEFKNAWDVWVYPTSKVSVPEDIQVLEKLGPSAIRYLEDGGKVLLSLGKGKVSSDIGGNIGVGFSTIFWNTAWTNGQKPHTMGILCNPAHPALNLFPTEYHSNWQWWDAMSHSDAIRLDSFNPELKPVVQIIDDWFSNRRLALLFEAKVKKGRIFISGADLVNNLDNRPEAKQLKRSILNYMAGEHFNPEVELNALQIQSIIR